MSSTLGSQGRISWGLLLLLHCAPPLASSPVGPGFRLHLPGSLFRVAVTWLRVGEQTGLEPLDSGREEP